MERSISRSPPRRLAVASAMLALAVSAPTAAGSTPESAEVKRMVADGVRFLEKSGHTDERAGALALTGMALLKSGANASHPQVVRVAQEIRRRVNAANDPAAMEIDTQSAIRVYSAALCVIFLAMADPDRYGPEIDSLLRYLQSIQKPHGGWGYPTRETGDTSMTQNAVLCFWEATQAGFNVPVAMLDRVTVWLLKTQDPRGGFGYQGRIADDFKLVSQNEVRPSMSTAGLGSLYILAQLLHSDQPVEEDDGLPPALKEVAGKKNVRSRSRVDPTRIRAALERGKDWMAKEHRINQGQDNLYHLYALERYHSFRELDEGNVQSEPKWYNDGVRWLKETQLKEGYWERAWGAPSGPVPDTAFAVLFLVRSTKKSIQQQRSFGDGTLIGGRGLPGPTDGVAVRDGKVVAKRELAALDKMLDALEDSESPDYTDVLDALAELPSDEAAPLLAKHGKKLRELAGDPSPDARLAVVRALGRNRNLDHVPTLIYALTDPDPTVVREARDGLRRVSRKFRGFGLPDEPTKLELQEAIKKWQAWYQDIRPDAEFDD